MLREANIPRVTPCGPVAIHRIHGDPEGGWEPKEGFLHGHRIQATATLTPEQTETLAAVLRDPACFGSNFFRCYFPGMGLAWDAPEGCQEETIAGYFLTPEGVARLTKLYTAVFPGSETARL